MGADGGTVDEINQWNGFRCKSMGVMEILKWTLMELVIGWLNLKLRMFHNV